MEGNEEGKLGVPIQEVPDSPENEAAIALVIKLRDLSYRLAIDKNDESLMTEVALFTDGLIKKHRDDFRKCRLYHVLAGSSRTKENVGESESFDFAGEDSIAAFCSAKLKELNKGGKLSKAT